MSKGLSVVAVLVAANIILSVALIFIAWLPTSKEESLPTPTPYIVRIQPTPEASPSGAPSIKNTAELDAVSSGLDSTDLDKLDTELGKLDSEASF